ncbi:MAG TPA: hypothetical protein PLG55_09950 [Methanospirillum sp.]|jgi:hypothetical protein|nr:hypothetical protein [Methanospirillum sp.]
MRGEKKSTIDVQSTSITIVSQDRWVLIPPNSREFAMSRGGSDRLREGVF